MKFGAFVVGLTLAVGAAVSASAQGRRDVQIFGSGVQLGVNVSDTADGVRVDTVHAATPAEKAGIREGDLVMEFDGERVRSALQLTRLVHETPEGRQVAVAVMRDGKRQVLHATPEGRASFGSDAWADELERRLPEFRVMPPLYRYENPRRLEVRPFTGSRGRLGVTVQSLTPDLEEYFGAKNGGALVSSVAQDSAAARAGVKAGDVITSINGRNVSDADDLTRELRDLTGDITIVLLRDRKEVTLKATIAERRPAI